MTVLFVVIYYSIVQALGAHLNKKAFACIRQVRVYSTLLCL